MRKPYQLPGWTKNSFYCSIVPRSRIERTTSRLHSFVTKEAPARLPLYQLHIRLIKPIRCRFALPHAPSWRRHRIRLQPRCRFWRQLDISPHRSLPHSVMHGAHPELAAQLTGERDGSSAYSCRVRCILRAVFALVATTSVGRISGARSITHAISYRLGYIL